MQDLHNSTVSRLVRSHLGEETGSTVLAALDLAPPLLTDEGSRVSRASMAVALGAVLFHSVLEGVASARDYVAQRLDGGQRIMLDHGALRTILFAEGPTGALPGGQQAFARILAPLGYVMATDYPLPRLKMTGHAWCHADYPQDILQYFVSELHVDQFDDAFAQAAHNVFDSSRDPLTPEAVATLDRFAAEGSAPYAEAEALLPVLAVAFACMHDPAALADYDVLLGQSKEAAWIATEGNSFNHATDRVDDVSALADALRAAGKPVKDKVEHSASGRVHQTAYRADMVERVFRDIDGQALIRSVPGSFFEFITRDPLPGSTALDLGFDSSNATGIFAMTRSA